MLCRKSDFDTTTAADGTSVLSVQKEKRVRLPRRLEKVAKCRKRPPRHKSRGANHSRHASVRIFLAARKPQRRAIFTAFSAKAMRCEANSPKIYLYAERRTTSLFKSWRLIVARCPTGNPLCSTGVRQSAQKRAQLVTG